MRRFALSSYFFGLIFGLSAGPAAAVVLPDAISYQYFGLNYANNILTSNTVGTLSYTGSPGCGSVCSATSQLGASPSVSATESEIIFDRYQTGGGEVKSSLGYYMEFLGAPGALNVTLHALDSLSAADSSQISASLRFGLAGPSTNSFNNFSSVLFQEADCLNGCPSPGFGISPQSFTPDNQVQILANTLYFLQMDLLIGARPYGGQVTGLIDPTFSTAAAGQFVFSPGVLGQTAPAVPEPSTWAMMLLGFFFIGTVARRRQTILHGLSSVA